MGYSGMVSYAKKYGKCGNDLLIIIPSFDRYRVVFEHLRFLSRQTFQKFDVALVLEPEFDDGKLFEFLMDNHFDFGVIVLKRDSNTGTAGGFFTGQKYGFEEGYSYMINADDDCMPADPGVVGALYSRREAGYVYPDQRLVLEKGKGTVTEKSPCTDHYVLFSRSVFERRGFIYAPIYWGADDVEFAERISKEKSCKVPNFVEHPYSFAGSSVLKNPPKTWIYSMSLMTIMGFGISNFITILYFCAMSSVSLLFIPMYGIGLFITMMSLLASFKYGKEAYGAISKSIKGPVYLPNAGLPGSIKAIDDSDLLYFERNLLGNLFQIFTESMSCFRKDVIVVNSFSELKTLLLCCFCRTVYLRIDNDNSMLMSSNRNILFHIIRILALPVFTAIYSILFLAAFIPIKLLKQPKTIGYGLDKNQ